MSETGNLLTIHDNPTSRPGSLYLSGGLTCPAGGFFFTGGDQASLRERLQMEIDVRDTQSASDYFDGLEVESWGEPVFCPLCDGDGVQLGQLGRFAWYRCRQCGMDFSIKGKSYA